MVTPYLFSQKNTFKNPNIVISIFTPRSAVWRSGSPSVIYGSPASASSKNLLEMKIIGSHPRPPDQKLWGGGQAICVVTRPGGDFDVC